jgi:hypothetical protein
MKAPRIEDHGMTRTLEALEAVGPLIRLMSAVPCHSQSRSHITLSETMKRLGTLLSCGF